MSELLLAGIAKQEITPPIGTELCGFVARMGPSTELFDRLWAKCLVLQQGKLKVALLFLDILGLNPNRVHELKYRIHQQTGIEHVMVVCSHTHAGPATEILNGCGETDAEYMQNLLLNIVHTVSEANSHLVPVRMRHASGTADKLTPLVRNRRQPGGPVDPILDTLMLHDLNADRPLAVLYRYTCHPVVLGSDNQGISNDWVGYASQHIEQRLGHEALALFANGPAGNINPSHRGTLDIARRMGDAIGSEVLSLLESSSSDATTPHLHFTSHAAVLELLPLFSVEALENLRDAYVGKIEELRTHEAENSLLTIKSLQVFADWAEHARSLNRVEQPPDPVTVEVQALRLGDIVLVALPGEVFVEYGLALREEFGDCIVPIGYANGSPGYIPWHDAYAQGGYEVDSAYKYYGYPSCIAPEGGQRLLDAARTVCSGVLRK